MHTDGEFALQHWLINLAAMSGLRQTQRLLRGSGLSAASRSVFSVSSATSATSEAVLARLAPSSGCTGSGQQPHLPGFHSSPSAWQPGSAAQSFVSSTAVPDAQQADVGTTNSADGATVNGGAEEQYTQIGKITSGYQARLSHPTSSPAITSINIQHCMRVPSHLALVHVWHRRMLQLAMQVPRKLAFAVVEVGPTQFKVSQGDTIVTEKLRGVDVNDKLSLNRVLMLGSPHETIIGRPFILEASITAAVEVRLVLIELAGVCIDLDILQRRHLTWSPIICPAWWCLQEQFQDGKVLIFKKRRRKHSRRMNGHRQVSLAVW